MHNLTNDLSLIETFNPHKLTIYRPEVVSFRGSVLATRVQT